MNILITGGGSGLGEALTRMLSQEPNTVYFTYSNSEANAKKIEGECSGTHAIQCNFKNVSQVSNLVDSIHDLDVDILINNAYVDNAVRTHFHKVPDSDFLNDFTNNVLPTIRITQAAVAHFRKKKKGKIITVLTSGLVGVPPMGWSSYTANKAYLASLVKTWASENIKFNITSNSISPSFMVTNLTSDMDERLIKNMISNHPLKRLLTVEEVAETVLFLTQASSHINGIDVVLNHGSNIR
ncbi:MAG: SDR family oxidoreductase [Bacteroidota bacterium]